MQKDIESSLEDERDFTEYIKSGMFEQDHGVVLPSTKKRNEELMKKMKNSQKHHKENNRSEFSLEKHLEAIRAIKQEVKSGLFTQRTGWVFNKKNND